MSGLEFDCTNVQLNLEKVEWEEAVKVGCQLLFDKGLVTSDYSEAIISDIHQYGPYVVIAEDFAMPHSRPENGVKSLGYSLLTFREPVDFMGRAARVVLTLAAPDDNSHIELLEKVFELATKNRFPEIANCQTLEELQNIIYT